MAARTGEQFLKGLRDGRELWVGGERIGSIADHPALNGAATALAEVFDLQHQAADVCLMPDPETGEPINVSHMIPKSRADPVPLKEKIDGQSNGSNEDDLAWGRGDAGRLHP